MYALNTLSMVAMMVVVLQPGSIQAGNNGNGNNRPIESWVSPPINTPNGHANVTMPEGTLGNTSIIVQTEPEATAYVISGQSIAGLFSIYTELGILAVNEFQTDYERGSRSVVVVIEAEAPDGSTATATLTVWITDVNDEPPTFSSSLYKAVVPETMLAGESVIGLSVTDVDEDPEFRSVILSIDDGNTDNLFTIFDDGVIRVAERENLLGAEAYYLTIKASDGANVQFTNVIIGICSQLTNGSDVIRKTIGLFTLTLGLVLLS